MEKVGIPDAERRFDEHPFQYSGGMRQRTLLSPWPAVQIS